MTFIRLDEFGPENDHDAILQEVIKLNRIGVETLSLKVVSPANYKENVKMGVNFSTYSLSVKSTWKQMTSPSCISL
jgi:hypothetical protein